MQLRLHQGTLQFCWQSPGQEMIFYEIGPAIDASYMSDETARGFTGTMIGMACVDSYRRDAIAHFDYFDLQHGCDLHLD
jgi:beta-xylosidase